MAWEEIKGKNVTWIDIKSPQEDDIKYLAKRFDFHELNLEDVLSNIQRPKIDEYKDHLFIVMHFPRFFKGSKRLITSEVDFFVGKGYMITIHNGTQKLLTEFFEKCKKDKKHFNSFAGEESGLLLYEVVSNLYENCFPMINNFKMFSESFSAYCNAF